MTNPLFSPNLRRAGFALIGIFALVAVALPSAAFAAAGPVVVEASADGLHLEYGKYNRGKPKKNYGYSYSEATENYQERYSKKSYGKKSYDKKSYGKKSYDKKSYGKKSYGKKSYGKKSYGKKYYKKR